MRSCAACPLCLLPDSVPCAEPCDLSVVYVLADPRDGAIRYVGSTTDSAARAKSHRAGASTKGGASPVDGWIADLRALALAPVFVPVAAVPSADLRAAEDAWIGGLAGVGCDLLNVWRRPRRPTAASRAQAVCDEVRAVVPELSSEDVAAPIVGRYRAGHEADPHPLFSFRRQRKLTLEAAGKMLGISNPQVCRIERGQSDPSMDVLVAMLAAGVDVAAVVAWHGRHRDEAVAAREAGRARRSPAPEVQP